MKNKKNGNIDIFSNHNQLMGTGNVQSGNIFSTNAQPGVVYSASEQKPFGIYEVRGSSWKSIETKPSLGIPQDTFKFYGVSSPCCVECKPDRWGYCMHSTIKPCSKCGRRFQTGYHNDYGFCHCRRCSECIYYQMANSVQDMEVD